MGSRIKAAKLNVDMASVKVKKSVYGIRRMVGESARNRTTSEEEVIIGWP